LRIEVVNPDQFGLGDRIENAGMVFAQVAHAKYAYFSSIGHVLTS
jgi:hypothetical protein